MRAKLPPEVAENVLAAARRVSGQNNLHFEIGRLLFTMKCHQTRMVQVKSFTSQDRTLPYSENNRYRTSIEYAVCPICTKALDISTYASDF